MEKENAKGLTWTTPGHELRGRDAGGKDGAGQRGRKGRKSGTTVIA